MTAQPEAFEDEKLVELSPTDLPLLRRLYASMRRVFGEDELDDIETWEDELSGRHKRCRILCVVALGARPAGGTEEDRPVIGGALWEYFLEAECFLYTYLYLDKAVPHGGGAGRRIAAEMWAAAKRRELNDGWKVRAVFVEFHDPDKVENPEADAMDPVKRIKMFQHMGARQVDSPALEHFQPPLHREEGESLADAEHCQFLLGVVVTKRTERDAKTGNPYVPTDTVLGFVRAYYRDCAGEDFESDPYFQRMAKALQRSGRERVPLVDFDCLAGQKQASRL